jgi:CheY-like chemotaxis protein
MAIVNDVLDLSKIESGKLELERVEFSIRELIHTACTGQSDRCRQKGIELGYFVSKYVPESLLGDPTRVSQIVYNLSSNAIKFTAKGSVQINVSGQAVEQLSGQQFLLRIEVIDTGIGIDPANIARLFEAYHQEKLSTRRQYGGTGLGLSIVKQLTERMGGSIDVHSTPDVGSNFTVQLLLDCDVTLDTVNIQEIQEVHWSSNFRSSIIPKLPKSGSENDEVKNLLQQIAGLRIIYADDSPVNLRLMKMFLKDADVDLILVENGLEAVRMVHKILRRSGRPVRSLSALKETTREDSVSISIDDARIDCVLLDVNMPIMSGPEAAELITSILPEALIVAVTANIVVAHDQKDQGPFSSYLTKPFTRIQLLKLLYTINQN